jgi:hypothetical protein
MHRDVMLSVTQEAGGPDYNEAISVWSSGGICRVNTFFFDPVASCFLYKAKDLSAPLVTLEWTNQSG